MEEKNGGQSARNVTEATFLMAWKVLGPLPGMWGQAGKEDGSGRLVFKAFIFHLVQDLGLNSQQVSGSKFMVSLSTLSG